MAFQVYNYLILKEENLVMSNNWYKYKDLDPKTRGIVMSMDKSRTSDLKGKTKLKHQVSIFFKLGNSVTNPYNAVDTIEIYEKFSHENGAVWISTDSLYKTLVTSINKDL